jgi:hypothetical protein
VFDRDGESLDGWVCEIFLKRFPGDEPIVCRVITAVDDEWPGTLTQFETKSLSVGHHTLIGKFTNETTDEEEQDTIRFNVAQAWE